MYNPQQMASTKYSTASQQAVAATNTPSRRSPAAPCTPLPCFEDGIPASRAPTPRRFFFTAAAHAPLFSPRRRRFLIENGRSSSNDDAHSCTTKSLEIKMKHPYRSSREAATQLLAAPHNEVRERCDGLLLLDVIQVAPQPRGQHAQPLGTLAGAQRALRAVQQLSGRLCHLPHLGRRAAGI